MSAGRLIVLVACFVLTYCAGVLSGIYIARHHLNAREVTMQLRVLKHKLERVNQWVAHWLSLILLVIFATAGYSVIHGATQHSGDVRRFQGIVDQLRQQNHQLKRQSRCFAQYANGLHDSLQPRQDASEALQHADESFNDALVVLLNVSLEPTSTVEDRTRSALALQAAAQHKQAVAARLSDERRSNPYPPAPKEVCPR